MPRSARTAARTSSRCGRAQQVVARQPGLVDRPGEAERLAQPLGGHRVGREQQVPAGDVLLEVGQPALRRPQDVVVDPLEHRAVPGLQVGRPRPLLPVQRDVVVGDDDVGALERGDALRAAELDRVDVGREACPQVRRGQPGVRRARGGAVGSLREQGLVDARAGCRRSGRGRRCRRCSSGPLRSRAGRRRRRRAAVSTGSSRSAISCQEPTTVEHAGGLAAPRRARRAPAGATNSRLPIVGQPAATADCAPGSGVLDRQAGLRRDAQLRAGVQVDGRVGLAGRRRERVLGAEPAVRRDQLVEVGRGEARGQAGQGAGAHGGQRSGARRGRSARRTSAGAAAGCGPRCARDRALLLGDPRLDVDVRDAGLGGQAPRGRPEVHARWRRAGARRR